MKPKPLDLEDLKETWIKIESLDGMPKITMQRRFGTFEIFQEIKQRIKQACEFYLRYKDNPELLIKEHPEFKEYLSDFERKFRSCSNKECVWSKNYELSVDGRKFCPWCGSKLRFFEKYEVVYTEEKIRYNEWLFRFAFNFDEVKGK